MDRSKRSTPSDFTREAPNGSRTPNERQGLLSFQRYSYSTASNGGHRGSTLSEDENATRMEKTKHYLTATISTRWADLILLVCFFMSGLTDAGAYNAYECFTSMQTGNTVFAALGVSNLPVSAPRLAYVKSLTSILCFLAGSALISLYHRKFGACKRWVIVSSFAAQALMTAIAAILVSNGSSSDSPAKKPSSIIAMGPNNGEPGDVGFPLTDLIPIGLLSFQAAGKVVLSRVVGFNAMPCVVLTTLMNDLLSDPGLFLKSNVQRNRRVGGVVFYFGGATAGGALARSSLGFAGALWITVGIKCCLVAAWMLWREEGKDEDEER